MNFFNFDARKIIFLIVIVALPILLIQKSDSQGDASFIKPLSLVAGLIQTTYSGFSSSVKGTTGLYVNLIGVKRKNRELVSENEHLKAQLSEMEELRLENERMNQLLGFQQKSKLKLLAGKIIGRDLFSEHDTLIVNRGSKNGVQQGMAVITNAGVVGYILKTNLFSSQIILLTDRYAAIDAIVQRTRARGIIEGKNKEFCSLNYLRREDDVQAGDLIITSGLNHIFPKGFPIGRVRQVQKSQYGISQEVEVVPAINVSQLEEVFLVLNSQKSELATNPNPEATPPPETKPNTSRSDAH